MTPLRILVTGSRRWPRPGVVWTALDTAAAQHPGRPVTVVHGQCRTGADAHAAVWAGRARDAGWDVTEEPHAANWAEHGRRAGPVRNRQMVEAGADLVLAFPLADSVGTLGTITLAVSAGLLVRRYDVDGTHRDSRTGGHR